MRVTLSSSEVFNKDPYVRADTNLKLPQGAWEHIYHYRFNCLKYTFADLADFLEIKNKKKFNERTIERWIKRTIVYHRAQIAILEGVKEVDTIFFGELKTFVEKEILKQ